MDCYYCAGTGLSGDGFHDCPVCGGDDDGYNPNDDKYEDNEGIIMQGNRRDIVDSEWTTVKVWDYGKLTHNSGWHWYCAVPDLDPTNDDGFMLGNLSNHKITEHQDRTITVEPSILIGGQGSGKNSWHGYLERGIWREV